MKAMGAYYQGHEYVDLGLPSGLLWATCNVGAENPEDHGDFFAWGETETYYTEGSEHGISGSQMFYYDGWKSGKGTGYTWTSYKWCQGSMTTIKKYCNNSSYGTVDNKSVLASSDDVAYVQWGDSWRMPTIAEMDELRTECTWTWYEKNGVNGYKVTSKKSGNTNYIFLPAAGSLTGISTNSSAGEQGLYWSSSLDTNDSRCAYYGSFSGSNVTSWLSHGRCSGYPVRPVCEKSNVVENNPVTSISLSKTSLSLTKGATSTLTVTYKPTNADNRSVTWKSSKTTVATVSSTGVVTAVASGSATITATSANGKTATCTVTVTNPVTSISLSKTSLSLAKGATSTLTVTYNPTDADNRSVTWKSSSTSVATVLNGTVTAVAKGTATITATSANGKTATCTVTVTNPVTSISLSNTSLSLTKGATSTLTVTYNPTDADSRSVTWKSSNTAVATVSSTGVVTAVASGSATITATSANGKTATSTVTVTNPITSISLSNTSLSLTKGTTSILTVTYSPTDADGRSVTWKSSNTSVATVSNGTVTAVGIGSATITATTPNGKTATCGVGVGPASVDLGLPSGTLWAEMNVGSTTPSDPGSYFAWGETTTKSSYTWASLKYCNNGSASSFSKYTTAGAELSISDDAAYSVMGSSWKTPSSSELQELIDLCTIESTTIDGQAGYLMTGPNGNTIFLPKNGYKYASSINDGGNCAEYWSRTLSNDIGWANELHIGTTGSNITGFSRQYGAGVRPVAANKASRTIATAISMSSTLSLAKGNSSTITVTFTPSSVSSKLLKWVSDNNSVATVDGNGKVTAVASGTAHITATTYDGSNISKTCTVTVTTPVSSISLSKVSMNLTKGGTSTLTVSYNPADADGKSVTWNSSNTLVAIVSTSGVVTAVASGTATITATSANGKTATCTVTVTNPVTSISLNQASLNLTKGGTSTLIVTYNPTDADSRSVTWNSSNTSVATVSTDGLVTAVASGTATITAASANGKTATCIVTVTNPVSSISLNQASLNLTKGGTSTLTVTYNPTDADSRSVTWKSSNTSVATVSTSGLVTAVASGTATITATSANGKTATCSVTVTNPVETVTLSETSIYLLAGDEQKIEATCTPIDADDCTITWSSSNNNVAVVDTEGNVTAKAAGSATITATSVNGKTATCTVSVTTEVVLTDGENYTQKKDYDCLDVSYIRTYTAGVWAAWYVPFDVVVDEDLLSKFEFAKLSGVLYEDNEWYIGAVKLKAGETVKALVPYLVKAKSSGEQTITAENTPLHAAADNGFSITSAENVFTFTGNCKAKTSSATDVGWYAMSTNGGFTRITKTGATMKGGRFFMTIADRSDNPYATSGAAASNFIRIREMGEATDVEEMMEMPVDETIYDLSGRRVDEPTESGIYIMNGKKIVIK